MVCFSLAVIKARVSPKVVEEIMASEMAQEGLRRLVEAKVGAPARFETRPALHAQGQKVGVIVAGNIVVNLFPTGITVQSSTASQATLEAITEAVDAQARAMAIELATRRSVALLQSKYVANIERTGNGATVVRIKL